MRSRRFSFLAGWTAVVLLALAGFAAFGTSEGSTNDISFEAATASIGHATGAYAGLTFALLGASPEELALSSAAIGAPPEEVAPEAEDSSDDAAQSPGTISTDGTGWLSEVQVRALVTQYFEPADVNTAVRIAWCESRFDPNSVNLRTGATGLFQHLPKYWEQRAESAGFVGADPTDPVASTAAAAWAVYNEGGWDIFACQE